MSTVKKLCEIFTFRQKIKYLIVFALMFIGSFFELLGVSMLVPFMGAIMAPEELMRNDMIIKVMTVMKLRSQQELVMLLTLALMLVYIIKNIYLVFMLLVQYRTLWSDKRQIETMLLEYYSKQDYMYHVQHNSSEMQRTILSDAPGVFTLLTDVFALISEIMTSTVLVIYLFKTSKGITVGIIILMSVYMVIYFKLFKNRFKQYGKISQECGSEGLKWMHQLFDGIKEVKINGAESFFVEKFQQTREKQYSMMQRAQFFQNTPKYLLEMVCTSGVLGIVLFKLFLGANISAMITQLTVFAVAAYRLLPAANRISYGISSIYSFNASVSVTYDAIKDMRANKLKEEVAVHEVGEAKNNLDGTGTISFENVSFNYPDSDSKIMKNVSLKILKGQSIGLKGASGAGKTTFIDVMMGLLEPTDGRVVFSGVNIKALGEYWRQKVGYIPQNIYLSDNTIRNNVAYGEYEINDEKVWKALEEAQLKEFVLAQPEGLNLMLGEGGVRLSGGQRQRIGIARALYHNPDILILDEATSALDYETEKAVMESINYFKGRKTMIIIAHRLSTIEKCDAIYEVSNGKVEKL